jgi:hypothetical protein
VADDSDSDDWYALDIGAKSIEMITPDTSIRAVIRAVRDLPPSDILLLGELLDTLRKPTSYETLVKPPYPADLVQARRKTRSRPVRRSCGHWRWS